MTINQFNGRFFDGKSGAAQTVRVEIGSDALSFEANQEPIVWSYRDIRLVKNRHAQGNDDIRLGHIHDQDAQLILPKEAASALQDAAPDVFSGTTERKKMTALIVSLIAVTAVVTAGLFWGVPAASGPLARATPKDLEMRIGKNISAQLSTVFKRCGIEEADELVTPALNEMAINGDVGFPIEFRFIRASAPNAFALPGGQVMATSGLLDAVGDDQEAFFAVMAHELGHVQARDSMQSVYRNAGLGVALEIITGGSGAAQQAVLVGGQLNQLRYTRIQESRADTSAYEIMNASAMDPGALARAFEAIVSTFDESSEEEKPKLLIDWDDRSMPTWMLSHPDTKKRITLAKENARSGGTSTLPLSSKTWQQVTQACQVSNEAEEDTE